MNKVLMSIKPKWADLIKSKKKTIELRTRASFKLNNAKLYFYESEKIKKVTFSAKVKSIDYISIDQVTKEIRKKSCLENIRGNKEGKIWLIYINNVQVFKNKRKVKNPPQSYYYIDKILNYY